MFILDSSHAPATSSLEDLATIRTIRAPASDLDLHIVFCKGKCMCTYPILSFVSYNHLSSSSCFLFTTLELVTIHKTVKKALFHPG